MSLLAIAIALLVAFGVAYAATPLVSRLARAFAVVDRPNERKVNRRANIPLLGGLAVALGFFVGIAVAVAFFTEGEPYRGHLEGLLLGGLLILSVGAFDDRYTLGPWTKLIVQVLAAAVAVFYGFRIAILFSLIFVLMTFFVGTLLGMLMGYVGGRFDLVIQRLIEIWEQIPFLYVVMLVVSIFRPEFLLFLGIFIIFGWTSRTWSVRAMTYRERERDYILAARTMGASTWRIVTVHILPNVLVVVLTSLPFAVEGGISALTALDYLGFGLRPPTPSWGELIGEGISVYQTAPWIIASVTIAMTVVLVLIAFVGEGLREAFDPKRYTVYK